MSRILAGRYELGPVVGKGGMAVVHRARDLKLQRDVAVKLITDPATKERFVTEARRTAQIRHPAVVEVFDVGLEDPDVFLVMELLDGESLDARLKRDGKLEPKEAVHIAKQICDALAASHALGVVHRDVKPANVFVLSKGDADGARVKVLDFGVAKSVNGSTVETNPGQLVGTMSYMAPEQIKGEVLDGRVDLYALGILLYRALSGRLPFQHDNMAALIHAHLNVTPDRFAASGDGVVARLEAVVLKLLSKDRDQRPADAAATRAALVTALEGGNATAAPAFEVPPLVAPAPAPAAAASPVFMAAMLELPTRVEPAAQPEAPSGPMLEAPAESLSVDVDVRPVPSSAAPRFVHEMYPMARPNYSQGGSLYTQNQANRPQAPPNFLESIPMSLSKRLAGYSALACFLYWLFFRPFLPLLIVLAATSVFGLVAYISAYTRKPQ